jgi:dCMP deaminase
MARKKSRLVPSWDDFYLAMAFFVSAKSKDPNVQHGAVIVDNKHRPVAIGINGVSKSAIDHEVDWSESNIMLGHAEVNAIDCADREVENTVMYVTNFPCAKCMNRIAYRGIRKVVYGPQPSPYVTQQDWNEVKEIVKGSRVVLERYTGNLNWYRDQMDWMEKNIEEFCETQISLLG